MLVPRSDSSGSIPQIAGTEMSNDAATSSARWGFAVAITLAPLFLLVGLLVAADVGLPLVFWQQRPGLRGRPFKLQVF